MSGPSFHESVSGHNVIAGTTVMAGGTLNLHTNPASGPSYPRTIKPCRVMPFTRNEDLIDRADLFARLEALVPSTNEYNSAALWGLGGSGKTQIALEYAYRRCRDPACSVFWAHADNETTFAQDYKTIAKKLGLDSSLDGEDLLEAVREAIEAQPKWLLVLDNADNLELFGVGELSAQAPNLVPYIPNGPAGTVLWTSRDKQIGGALVSPRRALHITRMREDEAKALLQMARDSETTDDEVEDATSLLVELQWLPLAISQAGAYMRRTLMPIKSYLSKLLEAKKRWSLLQQTQFDRHRRRGISNSILETWSISIDLIQQESLVAYHLLLTLAYFDNQNITLELVSVIVESYYNTHDQDSAEKDEQLEISITRLNELSFLSAHVLDGRERIFEMHKLVQEAIRYNLKMKRLQKVDTDTSASEPQNREIICTSTQTKLVEDDWKNTSEAYFSGAALQILLEIFPDGERETWAKCEKYLAHAVRVGDWAEICGKESEVSELLLRVSSYLYNCGRRREIEQVEVRALDLRLKVFGKKHFKTIRVMENLAQLYSGQGQTDKALQLRSETLALRREMQGERHPDTVWAMGNIATIYYHQGHYKKAMEMDIEVLEIQQEILGERNLDTITTMENIAQGYNKQEQNSKAVELQSKVLELRTEMLGEKHPDTITSVSNLAGTYLRQGECEKPQRMYLEILEQRREILGDRHPDTISTMNSLGLTYSNQGRYQKAEGVYSEVLKLRQEILGDRHPDTIRSISDLGFLYSKQGQYQKAEENHSEVVKLQQEVIGEKHPETISNMSELAKVFYQQRKDDQSKELYLKVLELRKEVLGEKDSDTVSTMGKIAAIYQEQGEYHNSAKLYVEMLEIQKETLGGKHQDTINTMSRLSTSYHEQGQYDKSEELDARVVELRKEVLGERHPRTIKAMSDMAATYKVQGKTDTAERIFSQVLELQRDVLGESHCDTIETMVSLSRVYYYQDLYDKAEETCARALRLLKDVSGEQSRRTLQAMHYLAVARDKLGRREDAISLMEKCWLGRSATLGDEHSKTLESKEMLDMWKVEEDCEGLSLN